MSWIKRIRYVQLRPIFSGLSNQGTGKQGSDFVMDAPAAEYLCRRSAAIKDGLAQPDGGQPLPAGTIFICRPDGTNGRRFPEKRETLRIEIRQSLGLLWPPVCCRGSLSIF